MVLNKIVSLSLIFFVLSSVSGCAVVHERRTLGSSIEDETIELKALKFLYGVEDISNNTHINATSYNGVVLLTGEAPTEQLRSKVVDHIRRIQKVAKVHNEIILAAPSSLISRSSDTLITSKAKIALLNINNIQGFDPTRVKIVTENGVVYLMGILKKHEVSPVIEIIRRVGGVQRVVKLFETIS
jgi:osmotically-inducible protein OsmY